MEKENHFTFKRDMKYYNTILTISGLTLMPIY